MQREKQPFMQDAAKLLTPISELRTFPPDSDAAKSSFAHGRGFDNGNAKAYIS